MPQPVTKRLNVTFHTGLPLGTRATFTHEGQRWIAIPDTKHSRIGAVMNRMLWALAWIRDDLTRWLSANPGDATRIATILAVIAKADQANRELALDKAEAVTQ